MVGVEEFEALKTQVSATKATMLEKLVAVQLSMNDLSESATSGLDAVEDKLEGRRNDVEQRQSAQEARIDHLESQIHALPAVLGEVKAGQLAKPTPGPGFNRDIDPTIILLRCKFSTAKAAVATSLSDWLSRS